MKNTLFILVVLTIFLSCKKKNGRTEADNSTAKDRDGNVYPTVKICDQVWMAKNLNVSTYRNGDPIPQVSDASEWLNLTTGAWCYYAIHTPYGAVYGKLYNWFAVNDPRGLAPEGWHIPSDSEWTALTTCLGGETLAGGKMKSKGTDYWKSPNLNATNSSGFSALPGGGFDGVGNFFDLGFKSYWWSSTEFETYYVWLRVLSYDHGIVDRYNYNKEVGLSVRCIKD